MTTFERVQKIIAEELGVDPKLVVPEASLTEDLGGAEDEMLLFLVAELNREFKISIPDLDGIKTVGDVVALVDELEHSYQSEEEGRANLVRRKTKIFEMGIRDAEAHGDFAHAEQLKRQLAEVQQSLHNRTA
jgi:acyl carrier protein